MRWTGESFENWAIARNIPRPVPRRKYPHVRHPRSTRWGWATWAGW